MSIIPEGEPLRRAIKWISEERLDNPDAKLYHLIEKAAKNFDLSPRDEEFLMRYFTEEASEKAG